MASRAKISIVTSTFNAGKHLPALIESLRWQTDKDFEWVVADGASTDDTMDLLKSITDINIVISSQPDFGIYDALNRAIGLSSGEYYIVAGADDFFYSDAIAYYRREIEKSNADIVCSSVMYGQKHMKVKKGPAWLFGQFSYIASHTLGAAFNKNLHLKFGCYSRLYPIAADQFFVMKACSGGAIIHDTGYIVGKIGQQGVSSIDRVGNATEVFRVQVALGFSISIQFVLFALRLLRSG